MDRNYFLSYSHRIAFLLFLAAMGNLNAKFISVTMTKPELSYYTDINGRLQWRLAGVSSHICAETENAAVYNISAHQKKVYLFYHKVSQYHFPFFKSGDLHMLLSAFGDVKPNTLLNSWGYSYQRDNEDLFPLIEETKKFCNNSVKLVDGFKFIIKIPDKLIVSPISSYFLQF